MTDIIMMMVLRIGLISTVVRKMFMLLLFVLMMTMMTMVNHMGIREVITVVMTLTKMITTKGLTGYN